MDFLRTLKKRRPRQYVRARVSAVSPTGSGPKRKGSRRIQRRIEGYFAPHRNA